MEVTLTRRAEELLREFAHLGPPEQIVEMALERLAADRLRIGKRLTAQVAVERILALRERNSLGGLSIKDLINEGRK
jgi:hypothetical protein